MKTYYLYGWWTVKGETGNYKEACAHGGSPWLSEAGKDPAELERAFIERHFQHGTSSDLHFWILDHEVTI